MKITFTPQRRDDELVLSKSGDVLTINGEPFDFSSIPDGASLPREAIACDLIGGDVERIGGLLHVPMILPIGPLARDAERFPDPITPEDGAITLPGATA